MKAYIGIDVGKYDLQISANNTSECIQNNSHAILEWVKKLDRMNLNCIICEATGGYERTLVKCLEAENLPVKVVHANRVRAFAKSMGYLVKTDKIDADIIANYAEMMKLTPDSLSKEIYENLRALMKRRQELIDTRSSEQMRLDKPLAKLVKASIEKHIVWLNGEIDELNHALEMAIQQDQQLSKQTKLLRSIPSIGQYTAYALLAYLPELFDADRKQLAALVGVAPFNRDSGRYQGKRFIQGGRKHLRKALYMTAVSSLRHYPDMLQFYQRLK